MVALIYSGWNLFVRLAIPDKHHEAITSRPLLLSSVGRLTQSGRQQRMVITSTDVIPPQYNAPMSGYTISFPG
jgi:hypothetical protein